MKKIALFVILTASASLQAQDIPEVRGWSLGAEVTEISGDTFAGLRAGWWHRYFGFDLSWWGFGIGTEADGTTITDYTQGLFGVGAKGGYQFGRLKPFGRLGFISFIARDDLNDVDYNYGLLELNVGIDFAITDHFNFGIGLFNYKNVLTGEAKTDGPDSDIDGSSASIFRGMHISYQF